MNERPNSFGYWLRRRRKALDMTQEALAQAVSCSRFAIRKIEADERRPSRRLAERLAEKLAIPGDERPLFMDAARAMRAAERLELDNRPLAPPIAEPRRESWPFVGRGNEFGLLVGLLARLTAGTGHLVLLEGEPGIGKSRLMREVGRYAQARSLLGLATRCYEIERAMPYQPVVELATQALALAPTAMLQKLPAVSLAEIAALVPALAERVSVPSLSADFPQARQARLFQALAQLFEALANGRQLVVMVDDIQWADDASAQFLHYFARHAASAPLLLLYAYRDEELGTDERLASLVDSLRREPHTRHMPLGRLQLADAEALLQGFGDTELARRLHRETEGNAFFLTSMLHALREGEIRVESGEELPLPDALRASVRTRVACLPKEVRPTLEVAAVLGRRFDFDTLLAVMREPESSVLSSLETLVSRRLLREESEGGNYDFSHDKVREVVYREIAATRRMLLHRALAETLEQRAEGDGHERDARLAEHYYRGRLWSKALDYMVRAAVHSQRLFAMRDAIHWLDRAIALAEAHPQALQGRDIVGLYEQRGVARTQAGQTMGAVADIRRVVEAANTRGDRAKARAAQIQLGMTYRRADDYRQASACLTAALAECRAMNDERHAADTLYHLGTVAWSDGRNAEAIACHQEAVELCNRLGLADLVAVQAYHGRGEAHYNNLEPRAAIACFARSIELARGIGDKSYECENLMMIGYASTGYMGICDYRTAEASYRAALDIARRADLQWHIGPTELGLEHVRACTGCYGEAWNAMNSTLRWLQSLKQTRYQIMAYDMLAFLLMDLGLYEQAIEHCERGLALASKEGIRFWCPRVEANAAIARLRLGGLDVGPALESALAAAKLNSERLQMARCLEGLAELALARGDAAGGLALASELLALAEAAEASEIAAQARRLRAEALAATGDHGRAAEELSIVVSTAQSASRLSLLWHAERGLARVQEALGDSAAAQRHRANAIAVADGIRGTLRGTDLVHELNLA